MLEKVGHTVSTRNIFMSPPGLEQVVHGGRGRAEGRGGSRLRLVKVILQPFLSTGPKPGSYITIMVSIQSQEEIA